MPNRRFDWHEHIKDVAGEYRAARLAVDRLMVRAAMPPEALTKEDRRRLREADANLEGTYLVRLFASFEAALRSYDRAVHQDPERELPAATLLDSIGGRKGCRISTPDRAGAHAVRELRNYWAHECENMPGAMTLAEAQSRLQRYLSRLPEQWD